LEKLVAVAPNWVAVQSRSDAEVQALANPLRASGRTTRPYELNIFVKENRVYVREVASRPLLPSFCPQRHLNWDGTFCLGLNAGEALADDQKCRAWWDKLIVFLNCQDTASETRTWPPAIELSHGAAGQTEVLAESIAERLGLLGDYQSAVRSNTGMIASAITKIAVASQRLRNGRSICVCGRTDNKGRPKLRRQCRSDGDRCLPLLEVQRRREEKEFWEGFRGKRKCCGTMDDCPLKSDT
jgi:hypothetical protein